MINLDENALRCDMMETYHILNWELLPARRLATLACGLGENSRIVRRKAEKDTGFNVSADRLILAKTCDRIGALINTLIGVFDSTKMIDMPSVEDWVLGIEREKTNKNNMAEGAAKFDTPEAYERARKKLNKG